MAATKKVPILDMGAAFVSAVLADNERLRNRIAELETLAIQKRSEADNKDHTRRRIIYLLAQKLGGDVSIDLETRLDDRRLLIDMRDYGRGICRVRLLGDDALAVLEGEGA